MKKPSPLKKGDTIGLISPAGAIKDAGKLHKAVKFLNNMGFKVKLGANVLAEKDYLAGNDEARLQDLHDAFLDTEINAILCARGGYGCTRLLDKIDYSIIENNPKIFLGHSDITAFLNNFPVVTFHSPLAVGDFGVDDVDEVTFQNFLNILQGVNIPYTYDVQDDFSVINSGTAKGELIGGNLCVLTSLLGTKYAPDFKGKILLLEDLNEPLYKIDRMLNHLRLAGVFDEVVGVVVANFSGIESPVELLKEFVITDIPAFYGFRASHEKTKYTLPLNVKYQLDADKGELTILENYLN